ncbi:TetR/AcrR family transcriptional regulator [Mesobacillus foraminis]|uniref:TetR/AcrR family transcriptional regulator n=1 Tax=Mesobacillus foraminis TaxID=279826 RepID=UPI000EF46709|nr:TetR/AcrR family transcriptional regulator [Mesobacillus foraminis]
MRNGNDENLVGSFPFVPRQERAVKKKDALLQSGRYLFITKGYENTTAKEIAAHAGVATGTFYRYFSDKRQLFMYLVKDKLANLLPPEPEWEAGDPEQLLFSLLENYQQRLYEVKLDKVVVELLPKDPDLAETLKEAKRNMHNRICNGLKRAQEKGHVWKDLDPSAIAWSVLVLLENAAKDDSGQSIDFRQLARLIGRMVFPPEVIKRLQSEQQAKSE